MLAHWDEVEKQDGNAGHLGGTWSMLGKAAGSERIAVNRIEIAAGKFSTPLHREMGTEEIFYVVSGTGWSLQDDKAYEVRAGDCIVHLAGKEAHTLKAGDDGLDVLVFGPTGSIDVAHLPRAGVSWIGGEWAELGRGDHPWEREVAAGEPELPEPSERLSSIVNVADVEGEYGGAWRALGDAAGSKTAGLNWAKFPPGVAGAPPHVHSLEEEAFVVLEGAGTLELWPTPQAARRGREREDLEIRAGHVVAFPPGGMAHGIRAGDDGMTFLAFGTREPGDMCFYPRSSKISFGSLGVIARVEDLDYFDGEPGE